MTGWKDIINRERGPTPVRSSLRALAAARGSRRHQSLANGAPPPFARSAPRSAAGPRGLRSLANGAPPPDFSSTSRGPTPTHALGGPLRGGGLADFAHSRTGPHPRTSRRPRGAPPP